MSAVLTLAPPLLSFSRNPLPVKFTVGYLQDYPSAVGSPSNAQFIIDRATTHDDFFNITWGLIELNFTFADIPDDSGLQLPTGDGSFPYIESLLPYLAGNPYIDRDFILAYLPGTNCITFQSRISAPVYSFQPNRQFSPVELYYTAGFSPAPKANYSFLLQVRRTDNDAIIYTRQLQLDYPVDGTITKDLSAIFNANLDYDVPDLVTVWQPCNKSFLGYYLKYAESYGDIPALRGFNYSAKYFAYLGGYSDTALQAIGATGNYLQPYLSGPDIQHQRWFESWPVDNIVIKLTQPAFLYFVNTRNIAENLDISVQYFFDDGTWNFKYIPCGILQPYQKTAVCCGFDVLGLPAIEAAAGMKIASYKVYIMETAGDYRTDGKTFIVDREYEPYTRYILFSDSCGNFKVMRLSGRLITPTIDVTDSLATRFDDPATPAQGNITRFDILYQETVTNNTGYIYDPNTFDDLKELMIAKKAFRIIDGILVPILITAKKFVESADGNSLNGFALEYSLNYLEKNYTGTSAALKVPKLNSSQTPI